MENKTEQISEYEQQAIDFLTKFDITFEAKFLRYDKHFHNDDKKRDIYECHFSGNRRGFSVTFGQSIANSSKILMSDLQQSKKKNDSRSWNSIVDNPNKKAPTAYDVLTCLTKSDPDTFESFCSEYGYDNDSRQAYATWESVCEEWKNVRKFFTDEELEQLQEIQ